MSTVRTRPATQLSPQFDIAAGGHRVASRQDPGAGPAIIIGLFLIGAIAGVLASLFLFH